MAPNLHIISSPSFLEGHKHFLRQMNLDWSNDEDATDAENLIEFSGRICYMSFGSDRQAPGTNADYISRLINNGHESVLEHASWTFILDNVTRSFTHQLVRNRIGFSYSQLSQQYHDEKEARFIEPFGLEDYPELKQIWFNSVEATRNLYKRLSEPLSQPAHKDKELSRKIRSMARSILPNSTATTIVVTANARSIRHFLKWRGAISGDAEMRLVSSLLFNLLKKEAPATVADFISTNLEDGLPYISQNNR